MDNTIALSKIMEQTVQDLGLLLIFLLIGVVLLRVCKPLKKLFLPAGLIGGVIALVLGPQVLGIITIPDSWSGMASPMINVVLTTTLFGAVINREKLKKYSSAIDIIVLTYFGQLFTGILVSMAINAVWKNDLPDFWGFMSVFTYWGGHGAATTAGTVLEDMGYNGMLSLGIIMATLGLIVAMLAGMVWVNIGERKGWSTYKKDHVQEEKKGGSLLLAEEERPVIGHATMSSDVANGLAVQLGIVLFCMWFGKLIFQSLAKVPYEPFANLMNKIPSLLYGIVGAIVVWAIMRKCKMEKYADVPTIKNIGGVALEICVAAATATLNLKLFASYIGPILIHLVSVILLMSVICFWLLPKWLHGKDWFELALMAFGQGHGSTPSGLALARCVDPDSRSYAWEGFGVALGVFTPVTSTLAAVLPILVSGSTVTGLLIGGGVSLACILFGTFFISKQNT